MVTGSVRVVRVESMVVIDGLKSQGGETSVRKNEGSEGGIIGVGVGTE